MHQHSTEREAEAKISSKDADELFYNDFRQEFLQYLHHLDRRALISPELNLVQSLEVLTNLIGKRKTFPYNDILAIYDKVQHTPYRTKFEPIQRDLLSILEKYVPFTKVPEVKNAVTQEKRASVWKEEISKIITEAVEAGNRPEAHLTDIQKRWLVRIQNSIEEENKSTVAYNIDLKARKLKMWIENELTFYPSTSAAFQLLEKIKNFTTQFETGEFFADEDKVVPLRSPEIKLPTHVEGRRALLEIIDHTSIAFKKHLKVPAELRVLDYIRSRAENISEATYQGELALIEKTLQPLIAKTNTDQFKKFREEILSTIEKLQPPARPEVPVAAKVTPPVEAESPDTAEQPLALRAELPPLPPQPEPLPSVLTDADITPTDDEALVLPPFAIPEVTEKDSVPTPPMGPGAAPVWEEKHIEAPILPPLPKQRHEPPTIPFKAVDLQSIRAHMNSAQTLEQPTTPPKQMPAEEDPFDLNIDLSDVDFGSLPPRENEYRFYVEGRPARYIGKRDENGEFHDENGKLIIIKPMSSIDKRALPNYEYRVEARFNHGKIVGDANVYYGTEKGSPLNVRGPVDEHYLPHGQCVAANPKNHIKFVGEFIHGAAFEGEFYNLYTENGIDPAHHGELLLPGVHFATEDLDPMTDNGEYFFDEQGNRLLDDSGKPLSETIRTRTYDSTPQAQVRQTTGLPDDHYLDPGESAEVWEKNPLTMVGNIADFESQEIVPEAMPVSQEKPAASELIALPDGTFAHYWGQRDENGKEHDVRAHLDIEGEKARTVILSFEHGVAERGAATVKYEPSERAKVALFGPVDENYQSHGDCQGIVRIDNISYHFEGEVEHGVPVVGLIRCEDPRLSYFGPVTKEFLPDDTKVLSQLGVDGIIDMTDADQTLDLTPPPDKIRDTSPNFNFEKDYKERFGDLLEKAEVSLPLDNAFAGAEQKIIGFCKNLLKQYGENKNRFLKELGEYLPEIHTYLNTYRIDEDGDENFSIEFRNFVDTLQRVYDLFMMNRTGEFYFYGKAAAPDHPLVTDIKTILPEFEKKYPETSTKKIYASIERLFGLFPTSLTEEAHTEHVRNILSILTNSDLTSIPTGLMHYLENKVSAPVLIAFIDEIMEDIKVQQESEPVTTAPDKTSRELQKIPMLPAEEKFSPPEASSEVKRMRAEIFDLISDTLEKKGFTPGERDALKKLSLSLRGITDLSFMLRTILLQQNSFSTLHQPWSETFRTFTDQLDKIFDKFAEMEAPGAIKSVTTDETDENDIHIPHHDEEDDDDNLIDPTEMEIESEGDSKSPDEYVPSAYLELLRKEHPQLFSQLRPQETRFLTHIFELVVLKETNAVKDDPYRSSLRTIGRDILAYRENVPALSPAFVELLDIVDEKYLDGIYEKEIEIMSGRPSHAMEKVDRSLSALETQTTLRKRISAFVPLEMQKFIPGTFYEQFTTPNELHRNILLSKISDLKSQLDIKLREEGISAQDIADALSHKPALIALRARTREIENARAAIRKNQNVRRLDVYNFLLRNIDKMCNQ